MTAQDFIEGYRKFLERLQKGGLTISKIEECVQRFSEELEIIKSENNGYFEEDAFVYITKPIVLHGYNFGKFEIKIKSNPFDVYIKNINSDSIIHPHSKGNFHCTSNNTNWQFISGNFINVIDFINIELDNVNFSDINHGYYKNTFINVNELLEYCLNTHEYRRCEYCEKMSKITGDHECSNEDEEYYYDEEEDEDDYVE